MKPSVRLIFKGVQELGRWVLVGIWNLLVNLFWLGIQLIELLVWAFLELRMWIQRLLLQVKEAIAQRDFIILLFPFKWLLLGIWQFAFQGFWLLIHLIELIAWYITHLPTVTRTVPPLGNSRGKSGISQPRLQPIPPENPPRKQQGRLPQDRYRAIAFIALCLAVLPLVTFIPFPHPFEGRILVEELSFRYGESPQSFVLFEEISGLRQMAIAGKQSFTLTGRFESANDPRLNRLSRLTVDLPTAESEWEIAPVEGDRPSELTLKRLWLRQHTLVEQFRYDRRRLQLVLQPAIRPNVLELDFGNQPLRVSLRGYQITELQSPSSRLNRDTPLEFTWIPEEKALTLTLREQAAIAAIVPQPSPQWIPGNLNVEDVRFYRSQPTQRATATPAYQSTAIAGQIQMARQSLQISQNDFLMGETATDLEIQKLDTLALVPDSPKENTRAGIQVGFSGSETQIQVGPEPTVSTQSIQGNFWNKWFSQQTLLALIPVWVVGLGFLIYWGGNNFSKIW
ncbi:hypothetical protein [Laspinema olomoucense]|uniref:Uncharacterized protein n=1 Tax=Laspinema olomoucense D3b TaxID=2953688 RepID=A0ABT2NA32_9CYAN|nr:MULTISPECIES: hypothetical protein [unclassified Laspinema]MCT7975032.1 hypothetical protein [Laspinema sp. D3d]MCT7978585.1 hypothetical protein [Laspinema sp. D3b]MCT7987184.1 hypothetical protein [Laspinema sp. D3a]